MGYYSEKLAGKRLRECYDIAPARVKQYLDAEIQYVLSRTKPEDSVLELGCGYGRVIWEIAGEAKRVARPGGNILFSSYSSNFWAHRLEWFELQSKHGLLGEIDYDTTGDGVIVCKDGFRAGAMGEAEFRELCKRIELEPNIYEVDESSIFYELVKPDLPVCR